MIAKTIALCLIPAGAAAVGVVGYMQHRPRAFTTETHIVVHAPPTTRPLAMPTPDTVPPEAPEVLLQPLVVKPEAPKPRVAKKLAKAPAPCSGWRDLGYDYVNDGKASGTRRVRELCNPNAPKAE